MARDWETWLQNATGPSSATEQQDRDRTEKRVRDAIAADSRLAGNVRIFAKGSYANNTNVRRDSDVDVAVEWKLWSYISKRNEAADLPWSQVGVEVADRDLPPEPQEYRRWIEEALLRAYGSSLVDTSGNKHIHVIAGSTTLDADVVPCFRHKLHLAAKTNPYVGIRLYPRTGNSLENWPEQNLANGNAKNLKSSLRYKKVIRAIKRLENDMIDVGRLDDPVHGYFIECLLYNLPHSTFLGDRWKQTVLNVLAALYQCLERGATNDWLEVNERKWLWRSGQTWSQAEAKDFAYRAWNYVSGN